MKFRLIVIFLCFVNIKSVPIEIEPEQEEGREPIEGNLEENLLPPGNTNNNNNGNLTVEERLVNVERRIAIQDQKINQVDDQMMYIVGILFHQLNWSKNNQNNQQNKNQFHNNQTPNQGNPNNTGYQNNGSASNYGNQNGSFTNNQNGNQVRGSNSHNGHPYNYQGNQSNRNRQQNNQNASQTPNNQQSNSHQGNSNGGHPNNRENQNGGNMNSNSRTGQGDQAMNTPQTHNGNPWQRNINNNPQTTNNRGWNQNGGQFNRHGLHDPTNPFRNWHQNNANTNAGSTNQQPQNTNNPNLNTGSFNQQWGQKGPFNPRQQRRGYFGGGLFSFEQNSMERTMSSMLFNRPMGGTSNGAESFEDFGNRRGMVFPNGSQHFFGSNRGQRHPQSNNHNHQHNNSPSNTMNPVGNPGQNSVPKQLTTTPSPNKGHGQNISTSLTTQSTNQSGPRNINGNTDNIDKTMINNSKSPKMERPITDGNIPNNRPIESRNRNEDFNNIITDDGFTGKNKGGKQKPFSPISNVPQTGQMPLRNQNTHNDKAVNKDHRQHEGEQIWSSNGQVNTNQENEEALGKEPREEFGQEEGEPGEVGEGGEFEGGSEREGSEVETQQAMMLSNLGESPYEHPPLLLVPSHVDEDND